MFIQDLKLQSYGNRTADKRRSYSRSYISNLITYPKHNNVSYGKVYACIIVLPNN